MKMLEPTVGFVGFCVICGKVLLDGDDAANWVYHVSRGLVCRCHPGVMEWYDKLLKDTEEELREKGVIV